MNIISKLKAWRVCFILKIRPLAKKNRLLNWMLHKIMSLSPSLESKVMYSESFSHTPRTISERPALKKRLFLDISKIVFYDAESGIQRVAKSILRELYLNNSIPYEAVPVQFVAEYDDYFEACLYAKHMLGLPPDPADKNFIIDYGPGDLLLVLDVEDRNTEQNIKCLNKMRARGLTIKFVVYDLLPIVMPENFSGGILTAFHQRIGETPNFDGVICISRSVADDYRKWLNDRAITTRPEFKISWFHLGADVESSALSRGLPGNFEQIRELMSRRPSFLMVSTIEPRKGHTQTLGAFEKLWVEGIDANLIIVGKIGWQVDDLVERLRAHPEAGHRLFWLEKASDECLTQLYACSTALIAASQGEGFGLPLIEAARYKKPIIVRDLPVFREVAGESALYFSGLTAADLAEALKQWLALYQNDSHPKTEGLRFLTWRESAEKLLEAL